MDIETYKDLFFEYLTCKYSKTLRDKILEVIDYAEKHCIEYQEAIDYYFESVSKFSLLEEYYVNDIQFEYVIADYDLEFNYIDIYNIIKNAMEIIFISECEHYQDSLDTCQVVNELNS